MIFEDFVNRLFTVRPEDGGKLMVYAFVTERQMWESNILLWKRIEHPATVFAKEKTVEAANDFYEAVYRMRPVRHDEKGTNE